MQEIEWLREAMEWLVTVTHHMGYAGVFIMTFFGATVLPIPVEATMIPVGILVERGSMNVLVVMIVSTVGTVAGAYSNYWLAQHLGREIFVRYGRYFLLNERKLERIETFFATHGAISTFVGRIIPGLRHLIALPAGLARMDRRAFFLYTTLGGFFCMLMLLMLGYFIGANAVLAKQYIPLIRLMIFMTLVAGVGLYSWRYYLKTRR